MVKKTGNLPIIMSSTSFCRLCICAYSECKSLFDEFGQENEVYAITVKYFDPIFFSSQQYPKLSMVVCIECWRHIINFHTFQQYVLKAQTKQEKEYKSTVSNIKVEDESLLGTDHTGATIQGPNEIMLCPVDFSLNEDDPDEKSDVLLPSLCLSEFKDDNPFSTDDEKPLINCLPKKTRERRRRKLKAEASTDKQSVPAKPARKPKIKNTIESYSETKTTSKRKRVLKEGDKNLEIKNETENSIKQFKNNPNRENSNLDSNQSSNDNDEDYDNDQDFNDSDNNHHADPDAFVSPNDKTKTKKQKNHEINAFIAEWKQQLECELCNGVFTNLALLRKHFSIDHPEEKCFVKCCQRKLKHRFDIVEHIRFHLDPNTFKCKFCGKVFNNSRNLKKHIHEKHTAEGQKRPFECTICQKRFVRKCTLQKHLETHDTAQDYKCSECEKGFSTEQRRKIHERMVHNVDRVCDQCGKTIHGVYALKQHILDHAGVKKRKWPCDQCNAELRSSFSLKRHKKVAHHDGSTVYVCGECGKIAPTETALRSHKKYVHQAERKFKCTICGKGFKVASVLREHMASHTGEHLYQCPHCPKTFKVNANMHHHRKKVHPKEWAEGRINKTIITKVDVNLVSNEVVI